MVALSDIETSNAKIKSSLPDRMVAVFVGATRGIGEATMRQFVQNVNQPKIYFTGRSRANGDKVVAEYKALNPTGEYIFIPADTSLIKVCDEVCENIRQQETAINLLFMSSGTLSSGIMTPENLHYALSVSLMSRMRITMNLLPLLKSATGLRRVVSVLAGTKEGPINPNDIPAINIPLLKQRGHLTSMMTLSLEQIAKDAPSVSFVHSFPGPVQTELGKDESGAALAVMKVVFKVIGPFVYIPIEEVGKRHLYLCTSAQFSPASDASGVPLEKGKAASMPTQGEDGIAVYSTDSHQGDGGKGWREALGKLRAQKMGEKVMGYQLEEFKRITGK